MIMAAQICSSTISIFYCSEQNSEAEDPKCSADHLIILQIYSLGMAKPTVLKQLERKRNCTTFWIMLKLSIISSTFL